jgi:hypothetical protein
LRHAPLRFLDRYGFVLTSVDASTWWQVRATYQSKHRALAVICSNEFRRVEVQLILPRAGDASVEVQVEALLPGLPLPPAGRDSPPGAEPRTALLSTPASQIPAIQQPGLLQRVGTARSSSRWWPSEPA